MTDALQLHSKVGNNIDLGIGKKIWNVGKHTLSNRETPEFSPTREQVKDLVKEYVLEKSLNTPFKNDWPGRLVFPLIPRDTKYSHLVLEEKTPPH